MRLLPLLLTACSTTASVQGTAVVAPAPAPSPVATPHGTPVLSWELKQSDRASIRTGLAFEPRRMSMSYVARPTPDTSVTLAIELTSARVTFSEDNEPVTHTAPIKLDVRVLDSGGYKFERVRCMGPHYQLAAAGQTPEEMLMHCWFRVTKPNANVGFTIYAWGNGTINDGRYARGA